MKIGLIDIDGHHFPNIPLMKLSTWHKENGDSVEWYNPMFCGKMDVVYMSKIFSFTDDYPFPVYADKIVKSGSGYAIKVVDGKEIYDKSADVNLPYEIEHIFPDYSLYPDLTKDTAYGFLTRGCPRNCEFCHVGIKEGKCSVKVADLSEFWNGQKNIVLCDPNLIACKDWKNLLQQLIDSKAYVDINQGLDIRLMTEEKAEMISRLKVKAVHFAWDRYGEKDIILPKLQMFKSITNWNYRKMTVFVLVNFDTTFEQDLERVYILRDMGFNPYIMIYNKSEMERKSNIRKLQRWVNNRVIFRSVPTFDEYLKK